MALNSHVPGLQTKFQDENGKAKCFQSYLCGAEKRELEREITLLCKIRKLGPDKELRVPKILTAVTIPEDNIAIGMVLKWIPGCDLVDATSIRDHEHHEKWKGQIEYIVEKLQTLWHHMYYITIYSSIDILLSLNP